MAETVTLHCSGCGEDFERPHYDVVDAENYYCSMECRRDIGKHECPWDGCDYTSNSELGIQQHHKRSHGVSLTKETFTCDVCGDEFERQQSRVERWDGVTCSIACRSKYTAKQNSGSNHYDYSKEVVTCDSCGVEFERTKHGRERTERNFCSHDCYGEVLSDNVAGEDNFNWRGGYEPYYGPTWRTQRRKALERDNYECQDCGLTRDEHYDEYGRDLHVHHITPFRTFDDSANANQLENLITLCQTCHNEHEHRTEDGNAVACAGSD